MIAHRADLRGGGPDDQVAAVAALPDLDAALFKDGLGLDVVQQRAVALLVRLLDRGHAAELGGELVEALLLGVLRHALVHVGPLEVLSLGGVQQIRGRVAQLAQLLEPELGVLFLVLGGLEEERGDLLIALFLRRRGKVGVFVSRLGLARKGLPQVLLGLGTRVFVGQDGFLL